MTIGLRKMKSAIAVSKVQYAEFFRLLFDRYAASAKIEIDCESYGSGDIERLKSTWCIHRKIRDTREFRLLDGEREVASFHDSVDELFISSEEVDWIRELSRNGILRFRVLPVISAPRLFDRVKTWIASAVSHKKKEPIQPPQRNAGSRPSSDDSPASKTSSSLGPRG